MQIREYEPGAGTQQPTEKKLPSPDSWLGRLPAFREMLHARPDLAFLLHAIKHYRAEGEPLRNSLERHYNERRDDVDPLRFDRNFWSRVWNVREKARRIIEGLEPWPPEAVHWKAIQELRYYHGGAECPAWLEEHNRTRAVPTAAKLKPASLSRLKRIKRGRR